MKNFNYSWRQIAKASFIGIATTATFYLTKTTGLFSSWLSTEEPSDALAQTNAGQRRLLQLGGVIVENPIPDQVIQVDTQYQYSLESVFSGNYTMLDAALTNQASLPNWLSLQYKLAGAYPASSPYGVVNSGNIVFVANHWDLLQIFDISIPTNPILLSTFPAIGRSYSGLALSGNTLFLGDITGALLILNVSDPKTPMLLSTYPNNGTGIYTDIAVSGSVAFVTRSDVGLQILDINNASNPRLVSTFSTSIYTAVSVAVANNTVFLGSNAYLSILDVTNISNPRLLSTYLASINDIAISGRTVFLADTTGNLQILDISNTSNPRSVSNYSISANAHNGGTGGKGNIVISGSAVFLAEDLAGLLIIDVSNTSKPRLLSSYPSSTNGEVYGVTVSGSMIAITDWTIFGSGSLKILDMGQGSLMGIPPSTQVGQQYVITVSALNKTAMLNSDTFTLTLDQLPRTVVSTLSDQSLFPRHLLSLSLSSDLFFVNPSASFLRLSITRLDGQNLPSWLNLALTPVSMSIIPGGSSIAVVNSNAFIASDTGLQILDISNPSNPHLLSTYNYTAYSVAASGTVAFVANFSSLRILDVNDPSTPRLLATYPSYAERIVISGATAFMACGTVGLRILDVSNTSNPKLLSTYPSLVGGFAYDVAVLNGRAFVADGGAIQILDVSIPSNPRLLSVYHNGADDAVGVAVSGNTVFVAFSRTGLLILDISNISQPYLLTTYLATGTGRDYAVAVSGSTVFLAAGAAGLQILDVSNRTNPILLSGIPGIAGSVGGVTTVTVSGNKVFKGDSAGVQILDISQWQLTAAPDFGNEGNYQLQLTATDKLGGSASTQPFTIRVEGPPQFQGNISTQFAKVGQAFNYFIPQGLVTDPNFDAIVFTAKLISGQSLPAWLSFNAISATFAGTPSSSAVGNATILLSVTDNIAGSVNTTFLLQVSHAPTVNQRIADQAMGIGRNNSFLLPPGTFTHADNLPLLYSAKRSNGLSLPAWLVFNPINTIFIGQPNASDAGLVSVQVTADDQAGGQASTQFNLRIENFPRINQPILAQSAGVGVPYRFSVLNSFVDDDGDTMTYQTSQTDGSSLPSWLSFNAFGLEFSGTPASSDLETFAIRFSATDNWGGRTDQVFNMTVTYFPTVGTPVYPQVSCVDQLYQFVVPSNTFLAGGAGFTYAARQSNGQPLPLWLSLDGISGTFSGIPAVSDVDQITLTLIGSANNGGTASTDFSLTTTTCPSLRNPVASRVTNVNTPFALTLAGDTFDNGGMTLTLSAERTDHSALPNWLSFNPVSGVLAGVPLASDVKMESLQVVARNPLGGQAVAPFNLSVCYFPTLTAALPTLPFLRAQRAFTFTVPSGTFISQTGALLQYQAQRADGSALPSWLAFNATQQHLFGTPGLTDLGNFNLQIIASDPSCGSTPAPLSLVVQQNYPPEVVHPLTNQVAAVGTRFTFFAPSDTFTDRNNDPLNYTAAQSNGQSLPGWLHFAANTLSFSGTPGRGDTDAFSDKVLTIALTAHDDKSQTSANFNINVQGTSNVLLFIKIAAPIFSVLTTALALYSQRGRILNHCKPQRYQRLEDYTVTVGEPFEYKFATPSEEIIKVRARIAKENKGCCRLFQVPRQALPGGTDLPLWMEYNPETNTLRTIGPVPKTKLTELFVQAKGSAERTLEQFTLRIVQPELSQEVEATEQRNLSSEPDAPTSSGSGDVEMQTLSSTTTATTPSMSF